MSGACRRSCAPWHGPGVRCHQCARPGRYPAIDRIPQWHRDPGVRPPADHQYITAGPRQYASDSGIHIERARNDARRRWHAHQGCVAIGQNDPSGIKIKGDPEFLRLSAREAEGCVCTRATQTNWGGGHSRAGRPGPRRLPAGVSRFDRSRTLKGVEMQQRQVHVRDVERRADVVQRFLCRLRVRSSRRHQGIGLDLVNSQGLSLAIRDVRQLSELLLATDSWTVAGTALIRLSPAPLGPASPGPCGSYPGRLRALMTTFTTDGRARRSHFCAGVASWREDEDVRIALATSVSARTACPARRLPIAPRSYSPDDYARPRGLAPPESLGT